MLSTARLILREFRESDLAACCEIDSDAGSASDERPAAGVEVTRNRLQIVLAFRDEIPRMHYRWAITICPADQLRGWISLTLNQTERREYEIGWRVNRLEWGKGYATEAAAEVLRFAFEKLGVQRVIAFCHGDNFASIRVMEKIGMRREIYVREPRQQKGTWSDEVMYAIGERDFEQKSSSQSAG